MNKTYILPSGFVFILAMLTSISPLAIDTYLPSFLEMSKYFDVSISSIELTLSIYLLGFGLGQLIGGPLSDRYGRKTFIIFGIYIYIICSYLITLSASIEEFFIYRFLQAIGGGFAVVNTNAIVRDIYHGNKGAKVFSTISMIMMIAPMIAPAIGAFIVEYYTWQKVFIFLMFYALVLSYFIFKLPETSPKVKSKNLYENYIEILKNKKVRFLIFANGFAFSGMFIFIAKSSFIYMDYFHMDTKTFPVLFGLNVFTLILFSRLNIYLLKNNSTLNLFKLGIKTQVVCAMILLLTINLHSLYLSVILIMFYIGVLGIIFANAISLLLEDYKHISATANALNGVLGFVVASIVGSLASFFHNDTLVPIYALMLFTSIMSFTLLLIYSLKK